MIVYPAALKRRTWRSFPTWRVPIGLPLDAETKKRLNEIEKTLSAVAQQLSSSEVVKLPDGSSVTRADLAAYTMTQKISEELKTTTSASADLAEAVRKRGHVRIDTGKLTEHAVKVLDDRLAEAVEVPVQGSRRPSRGSKSGWSGSAPRSSLR